MLPFHSCWNNMNLNQVAINYHHQSALSRLKFESWSIVFRCIIIVILWRFHFCVYVSKHFFYVSIISHSYFGFVYEILAQFCRPRLYHWTTLFTTKQVNCIEKTKIARTLEITIDHSVLDIFLKGKIEENWKWTILRTF